MRSRIQGCWQIWCLVRAHFAWKRTSSYDLTWVFYQVHTYWEISYVPFSFNKGVNLIMKPLPSYQTDPSYLQKAPPPNTITLGIRALPYEFGGDTNIQSILGKHCGYLLVSYACASSLRFRWLASLPDKGWNWSCAIHLSSSLNQLWAKTSSSQEESQELSFTSPWITHVKNH